MKLPRVLVNYICLNFLDLKSTIQLLLSCKHFYTSSILKNKLQRMLQNVKSVRLYIQSDISDFQELNLTCIFEPHRKKFKTYSIDDIAVFLDMIKIKLDFDLPLIRVLNLNFQKLNNLKFLNYFSELRVINLTGSNLKNIYLQKPIYFLNLSFGLFNTVYLYNVHELDISNCYMDSIISFNTQVLFCYNSPITKITKYSFPNLQILYTDKNMQHDFKDLLII